MLDTNQYQTRLNLGCGNKKRDGYVGVDRYPCEAADLLCDLTKTLPFATGSVDEIVLDNVIEHIFDIPALLKELVRVARRKSRIIIITPHFTSLSSWKDPTHIHHLSYFSFDHFEQASVRHYLGVGVKVKKRKLSFGGGLLGMMGRIFFSISPEYYEKKLCFIFRASTLEVVLEVT